MSKDQFTRPFYGVIDDVRVWDEARTPEQIQARMFERLYPKDELMSALVGYWRCNLGTGRVVADQTLSSQHAVMRGKVDWKESAFPITERLLSSLLSLGVSILLF